MYELQVTRIQLDGTRLVISDGLSGIKAVNECMSAHAQYESCEHDTYFASNEPTKTGIDLFSQSRLWAIWITHV